MTTQVDPACIKDIRAFGAFDVNACFNCGNCTAVCPLSIGNDSFPRRMIRYAQIGARDRLIASKEVWLCYYCGECSDTCPRQAEPGEFMAAARRYAIASFDPTGISRRLYTSPIFTAIVLAVLSALFAAVLLTGAGPMRAEAPALFEHDEAGYLSYHIIHDTGLVVIAVAVVAALVGILRMVTQLSKSLRSPARPEGHGNPGTPALIRRIMNAAREVATELAAQRRYRDCEEDTDKPWYRSRWFVHWAIMWGFIGLAAATGIDYLWTIVSEKAPGKPDPLWYPGRLVGTVAGLFLMYGVTAALVTRFTRRDKYSSHSLLSDWLFLAILFLTGLTGFLVEIAVYLPEGTTWGYVAFLVHVVLGFEIVVLLPFTKFAHAVYRPIALFIHSFARPAT